MLTDYWRNTVLNTMYRSAGQAFYVGLSSTEPHADGTNVHEPDGGNYARCLINSFTTPCNGTIHNSEALEFPISTAAWFTDEAKAAYYVIFDGAGANARVLGCGSLVSPMVIDENVSTVIAAGVLSITLTDELE